MEKIKNLETKNIFFLIVMIIVFLLTINIFLPFLNIIIISLIIVQIFYPIYRFIFKITRRTYLATTFSILISIIFFIVPVILLCILIFRQIESILSSQNFIDFIKSAIEYVNVNLVVGINTLFKNIGFEQNILSPIDLNTINLENTVIQVGRDIGNFLFSFLNQFINILFSIFLIIITLIFMFPNYDKIDKIISFISPLDDNIDKVIAEKFISTIKGVIKGSFGVAFLQATAVLIPLVILGVEGLAILWLLMFILSIVPIGSGLVWFPIGSILIIEGINIQDTIQVLLGIGLILYSAIVINVIDSTIRPKLMKNSTNLHPIVVIFSVLGGIYSYGILGIVYGPLIVVMFLTIMSMYREKYLSYKLKNK
ncbi:MAG: AI-2E family transporter [Candidatus Dojkabacteria bacterium]|nr:AI-2E family transporter [Candidatus Dojkabacteria bacterium]